jgi:hypothetical protein
MITFFLLFALVTLSCIGYGNFLNTLFHNNIKGTLSLGYQGLLGILILNLYSYFYSIFFYHTEVSNVLILLIGLFLFLWKWKKLTIPNFFFLILVITFLTILIGKPHDDFHYYHFPYTEYLNSMQSVFGVGHLNHGFRTPSSIFYLNSLFNFPILQFMNFHYGAGLYFLFANMILYEKIKSNLDRNTNFYLIIYSVCVFLFINIFFYRIGAHGTDRSAQILALILFLEILHLVNSNKNFELKISLLFILISLIVSLKAFYILYILFGILVPMHLYFNIQFGLKKIYKILFFNPLFFISLLNIILILTIYAINTGCLIYPLHQSCIESLPWAISKAEVITMNNWYELWSKGGATPNFRVNNPEIYIQKFNWVSNWVNIYFFNKVSEFILGLIFISAIIYLTFRKSSTYKFVKINFIGILIIILILLFEWFYNHPALRYGGYCLIAALFFIPLSIILSNTAIQNLKKKIIILCSCALLILVGRNINRLQNEYQKYSYNPILNVSYNLTESDFRIHKQIDCLKSPNDNKEKSCKDSNIYTIKKIKSRYMIINND